MPAAEIKRDHDRPTPLPLLAEAGSAMILASLAIRVAPFRALAERLSRNSEGAAEAHAETVYWIRRAVLAWSRRLPWRTLCFEQGLTAFALLQRRNLAATLHYGAATMDGALQAHVWVTSGRVEVIGCETKEDYGLLARFPS